MNEAQHSRSRDVAQPSAPTLGSPAQTRTTPAPLPNPHISDEGDEMSVQKITVLFVDDDILIAMTVVDMLKDLGHDVIEANSATRALEILRSGCAVDLLITDYSMPKMNGAQLASAARELRPDLHILLATGYTELPTNSGLDLPKIAKPYGPDQLATAIAKVLTTPRPS
jgi:CheY-like chemotaxis protein